MLREDLGNDDNKMFFLSQPYLKTNSLLGWNAIGHLGSDTKLEEWVETHKEKCFVT